MIPLYILSAQTRNLKITTHTTYYIIPLPSLQARELKNNFPISFQLRVSFLFSFFFKDPMYYCTDFINYSFLHVPPVVKLFLSRRSRIPYSYVATCRISTKEREHASQSKRRRPQYGNHSTILPFGNDEHTFYIRLALYIKRTVFTVHEEVVKKTTSAPWEKEHNMQSLHLLSSC